MTVGGQPNGNQPLTEPYSLVVTEEDLEKRRLDRERARKLSQETNRRRKALEERKKLAEDRENKKRNVELSKRRQKQTDATERYQRSHLNGRTDRRPLKFSAYSKGVPSLDNVLQQLRSGSTEISYLNNGVADPQSSYQLATLGRSKFESKLQDHQRSLAVEQHKINTLQEFQQELRLKSTTNAIPQPSAQVDHDLPSDLDSLDGSVSTRPDPPTQYNGHPSPAYGYSTIDLMSGRATTTHDHFNQLSDSQNSLTRSLSRLFIHNQPYTRPNYEMPAYTKQTLSPTPSEKPNAASQIQIEDAEEEVCSDMTDKKIIENEEKTASADDGCKRRNEEAVGCKSDTTLDDQESLHGSTSSGASPVNNASDVPSRKSPICSTTHVTAAAGGGNHKSSPTHRNTQQPATVDALASRPILKMSGEVGRTSVPLSSFTSPQLITTSDNLVIGGDSLLRVIDEQGCGSEQQRDGFYVKSYRPRSSTVRAVTKGTDAPKPTPSAVTNDTHHTASTAENEQPTQPKQQPQQKQNVHDGLSATNKWSNKPKATPISSMYSDMWPPTSSNAAAPDLVGSRSVVLLARPASATATPTPLPAARCAEPNAEMAPLTSQGPKVSFDPAAIERKASGDDEADAAAPEATSDTLPDVESKKKEVKSILKKVSKYGPTRLFNGQAYPLYHTAAAVARQQWVDHITNSNGAALNGADLCDSLDPRRRQSSSAPPGGNRTIGKKSVVWNEIQYDDGTSASISESGAIVIKEAEPALPVPTAPAKTGRGAKKGQKGGKPAARAKSAPPAGRPGGAKTSKPGASGKGAKGRKLKVPAKEAEVAIEPHPPPTKKKQLTMTTNLHYSIHDYNSTTSTSSLPLRSKIAWNKDQDVTMDTLKSGGSLERRNEVVRNGNHVTIHITSQEMSALTSSSNGNSNCAPREENFDLVKTPTDQEINQLWEKVRSCIAQRPTYRDPHKHVPTRRASSDTISRYSGPSPSGRNRRAAWMAPQPQQPSIVSIDGGMLQRDGFVTTTPQQRGRGRRLNRPVSAAPTASHNLTQGGDTSYGAFARRQVLLQQRKQKHYVSRGVKPDIMKSIVNYPSPKQSAFLPASSPIGSARDQNGQATGGQGPVSDSTTAFLLAETLAEQNMSEDQILRAMDSLQRKSHDAQKFGKSLTPSSLSSEEQRLLASLERLNSRLREVESAVQNNPNMSFFSQQQANNATNYQTEVYTASPHHPRYYGNRIGSAPEIRYHTQARY